MTDYTILQVGEHETFILDQVLPLIFSYARASNTQPEEIALVCFMSLATTLQTRGLSSASLVQCIEGIRLPIHEAPEGLQ